MKSFIGLTRGDFYSISYEFLEINH